MPTYQYSCTECGHFFEQFQSFNEDSLTVCPECQGRLRKVFNAVGVVFKGSGFYRTDSRASSGASGETAGSSGGSDGSAKKAAGSGEKAGSSGTSGAASSGAGSSGGGSSSGSSTSAA